MGHRDDTATPDAPQLSPGNFEHDEPAATEVEVGDVTRARRMPVVIGGAEVITARFGTQLVCGTLAGFQVRLLTARGLDHAANGEVADDAAVLTGVGDAVLVAVADGVGSQRHSDLCATEALAGLLVGWNNAEAETLQTRTLSAVESAHAYAAAERSRRDGSGACTLSAVGMKLGPAGWSVVAAVIGDSPVCVLDPSRGLVVLAKEPSEDGSTRALPTHDKPTVVAADLPGDAVLLVMTDGFEEGLFHYDAVVRRRVEQRWRQPPTQAEFVATASFMGEYLYDDRTIIGVWAQ